MSRPDRSKRDKNGKITRTDHPTMSDVFKDVMTNFGLNKGKQQKEDRDRKIKKAGG